MPQCRFVWYELMTTEAPAATAFYSAVIGWSAAETPVPPDRVYTVLSAGAHPSPG